MRVKQLDGAKERTFALVFDSGDEAVSGLLRFAGDHGIQAAEFTGIGAFSDVVLGFFDLSRKEYLRIPQDEQVEIVSLTGNFATQGEKPKVHAHVVVARRDASALGGHLLEGHVRPTLEVVVTETPGHLRRETDEATGLALLKP